MDKQIVPYTYNQILLDNKNVKSWMNLRNMVQYHENLFFKDFFLERGEGGRKRGRETSVGCLSPHPQSEDLARNPGMFPDWERNRRPFGLQDDTQPTEPHQSGYRIYYLKKNSN